MAGLGGFFVGILLAFLTEHLDRTIKTLEQLEERLGVVALGLLPFLKLKTGKQKGLTPLDYAMVHPKSAFSEAIRTLRTGVLLSSLDNPHKVILVTSSTPGEGKSTVASNLATSLGELHKVLLIDTDLRRPTIARQMGLDDNMPGLSELVSGSLKLSDCIHKMPDSNLYVMPSGVIPPNPLELLSSNRFAEALEGLVKVFDHIVMDSAPTLAVSDALLLSTHASGVVFVVKADATPYPIAINGIKRLQQSNAHVIGTVLNQLVPQKARHAAYGYGKYGYYTGGYVDEGYTTG